MSKMKTYFIRHNAKNEKDLSANNINKERIKLLCNNKKIGLFYDNAPWDEVSNAKFWDNDEHKDTGSNKYYRNYKTCSEYFNILSKEGGYVFCEYEKSHLSTGKQGCFLGIIKPNSSIEIDCDLNVTLQLHDVREISYSDFPVLLAIRPPFGTMCVPKRKTYSKIAELVYLESGPSMDRDLLHPNVAEQMCVEYLRIYGINENKQDDKNNKLDYLFLNVGKTMKSIDIAGRLGNGKRIFAQVKNDSDGTSITKDIITEFERVISTNDLGIIFSSERHLTNTDNLIFINIDDVFNNLKNDPHYHQMIRDMIGINFNKAA